MCNRATKLFKFSPKMLPKVFALFRKRDTGSAPSDPEVAAAEKAFRLNQLATDSKRLDAEAEVTKAKAEATKAKAEATKAEAKRVAAAEADAVVQKAASAAHDALAAKQQTRLKWATELRTNTRFAFPFVLLLGIAIDWWYHDYEPSIKWRIKRKLRSCPLPPTAKLAPPAELPTHQKPLSLGVMIPSMLLGPTGSGKSTLLAKLARESVAPPPDSGRVPTPTVLIKLRLPLATATAIYEQIGFPQRHSFIYSVRQFFADIGAAASGNKVAAHAGGFGMEIPVGALATASRVQEALGMLYHACEELQVERMETMGLSDVDASCVVLIDEAQDLIEDSRLAAAGGRRVFDDIGKLAVVYGVDRRAVRTVVAGSSAFLALAFEHTGLATGSNSEITKVLYLDSGAKLHFQSELHRHMWPTLQHEYVPAVPEKQLK